MEKVDYDARLHAVYAAGRQMSPDALQTWMDAFARHLPAARPLVWLDLGSGAGRMTPSLASAFGGPAHGVEPSDKMRAQALAHAGQPAVTYGGWICRAHPVARCLVWRSLAVLRLAPRGPSRGRCAGVAPGRQARRQALRAGELLRQDA